MVKSDEIRHLPQSLSILDQSGIVYPQSLKEIRYASALVGLFEFDSKFSDRIPFIYLENPTANIFSLSNQQSKGVSRAPAVTVVMNPQWSEHHFEFDESHALSALKAEFEKYLNFLDIGLSLAICKSQLKKWRYSHPQSRFDRKSVSVGPTNRIVLLGDAFSGGSIRGALDSALSIALEDFN